MSILVTLAGIDMLVIPAPPKALLPIVAHFEPLSNDTLDKLPQELKACQLIVVTLAGIDMLVIPEL